MNIDENKLSLFKEPISRAEAASKADQSHETEPFKRNELSSQIQKQVAQNKNQLLQKRTFE